jgi:hypothetical protein
MHILLLRATLLGLLVSSAAHAQLVTFDFNSLENRDRDRAISDYMTAVYGSPIETDGARVTNETAIPGVETDLFIATSLQLINRGDFIIDFLELPILGVQFVGHVLDPTIGDDFQMRAFNGDAEVFAMTRDSGVETFDSGWIPFTSPVDRLVFSDSGRKDVGIDDMTVQVVPEPVTAGLLLAGLAGLALRRRT